MTTYDGRQINTSYLSGFKQMRNEDCNYCPTQQNPTKSQWNIWKELIHGTFLAGLQLVKPIQVQGRIRVKQELSIDQLIEHTNLKDKTISYILTIMPSQYQHFVTEIDIPNDDCKQMLDLMNAERITGATDGSYVQFTNRGSGAFLLLEEFNLHHQCSGGGMCALCSDTTSQTVEHYGLIDIHLIILSMILKYKPTNNIRRLTIWIDNQEVLDRARKVKKES